VIALTRVNHPHIVQLLGVQVDMHAERVYMVMELCQGGELFDRIAECGGLAEDEARRYFAQTLHALAHCHENRVYHRDLKPENILLDADDNVKVADFGLAAVYRHVAGDAGGYLQHTKVGSVMYAAPEVLTSTAAMGYDAARADMWSLGVILFSMLSGTLPFTCAAASKCKRYAAVLTHGVGVMCPEHLSPQVTQLLGQLLHPDPAQRITPAEALQSEWLCSGQPTQPMEYLGRVRPAADTESRSWTITMRAPQEQMRQLASSSAAPSGASASAGAVMGAASSCGGCGCCSSSSSSSRSAQETPSGGDADAKRMRVGVSEVGAVVGESGVAAADRCLEWATRRRQQQQQQQQQQLRCQRGSCWYRRGGDESGGCERNHCLGPQRWRRQRRQRQQRRRTGRHGGRRRAKRRTERRPLWGSGARGVGRRTERVRGDAQGTYACGSGEGGAASRGDATAAAPGHEPPLGTGRRRGRTRLPSGRRASRRSPARLA